LPASVLDWPFIQEALVSFSGERYTKAWDLDSQACTLLLGSVLLLSSVSGMCTCMYSLPLMSSECWFQDLPSHTKIHRCYAPYSKWCSICI
jgi:hypothetical protein